MRVCKRLQIDYAEAVVDFEFGHRMAVPVIQGVVIAEEHYEHVMEELEKDEAERKRKEDEKRRKAALNMWRKFLMGMRIAERIRQEYGEIDESISVFGHSRDAVHKKPQETHDEDIAGGFLPEGYEEEDEAEQEAHHTSNFFPIMEEDDDGDNGLVVEDHAISTSNVATPKKPDEPEPDPEQTETGQDAVEVKEDEAGTSPLVTRRKPRRAQNQADTRQNPPRRSTRRRTAVIIDDEDEEDDDMEDAYVDSEDDD